MDAHTRRNYVTITINKCGIIAICVPNTAPVRNSRSKAPVNASGRSVAKCSPCLLLLKSLNARVGFSLKQRAPRLSLSRSSHRPPPPPLPPPLPEANKLQRTFHFLDVYSSFSRLLSLSLSLFSFLELLFTLSSISRREFSPSRRGNLARERRASPRKDPS